MRHVLSHSSGLGHSTTSRDNIFAPGRGYSYSAIGYQYLQAVIEQVTEKSLEDVSQAMVFAPLKMTASSYIVRKQITHRVANGHVHALVPVLFALVTWLICVIAIGLIAVVVHRVTTGHWRPSRRIVMGILTMAFVCALVSGFTLLLTINLEEFGWLLALSVIVLAAVSLLVSRTTGLILKKLLTTRPQQISAWSFTVHVLIILALTSVLVTMENVPVPKWPSVDADAAGTMRATTTDLANFLIELSNPKILSREMAGKMRTAQIGLRDDLSWGLGPGIHHAREGDALWQWGQHIDFQSFMLIYPAHGFGIVVCTNNDLLKPQVALEIAHRALGGSIESIRGGLSLAYNYRE